MTCDLDVVVVIEPDTQIIAEGFQGPPGAAGTNGTGGDLNYVHQQSSASALWTITHNLDKFPSVSVQDSAGTMWEGEVAYVSQNLLTISFSAPFSGTAYLN